MVTVSFTGGPATGPKGLRHAGAAGIFITARPYDPPSPDEYRKLATRVVELHPVTLMQNARTSGGGNVTMVPI